MVARDWKILVVEDEYDSQQTLSAILKFHQISIHVSNNGKECLNALQQFEPTAIVMDLAMPEMDGWQTLAEIRANQSTAHLPVIALTAYYSVDMAEDVLRAGFDGYFAKPVNPRSFVQNLTEIIEGV